MSDSALVTQNIPAYAGNYTKNRVGQGGKITEITVHHTASLDSVASLGKLWQRVGRKGSSHYGVCGAAVGQYVAEADVAWTNSQWAANCRAVTIETCNSGGAPNWPVADDTLATLIALVADIARRRGLGTLVVGKNLTMHNQYAATACPGLYLKGKMQYIADRANTINSGSAAPPVPTVPPTSAGIYYVQVGAFAVEANARSYAATLEAKGFASIIKQSGGLYRVQLGAFAAEENAENFAASVRAAGFQAIVTQTGGTVTGGTGSVPIGGIQKGDRVNVDTGAKDYNGRTLAGKVYRRSYYVQELRGDRAVIGPAMSGAVTAAINTSNLRKV